MKIISTMSMRANIAETLSHIRDDKEWFIVTRNRKPVAVVMPVSDIENLRMSGRTGKPVARGEAEGYASNGAC